MCRRCTSKEILIANYSQHNKVDRICDMKNIMKMQQYITDNEEHATCTTSCFKYYNLESMTSLEENLSHFFLSLSAALNLFLDTFVAWTLSLQKGKFSILENSDDEMIFMDMLSYRSNEYFTQSYTFFLKYTDGHAINVSNLTYELYIYIHVSFLLEKILFLLKNNFNF